MSWTLYAEGQQDSIEATLKQNLKDHPEWAKDVKESARCGIAAAKALLDSTVIFHDDEVAVSVNGHVPEDGSSQVASIGISINNYTAASERLSNGEAETDESASFEPEGDENPR